MTRLAAIAALLMLCGCGGGGSQGTAPPAGPIRPGILFGFYGDAGDSIAAEGSYSNLAWIYGWDGAPDPIAQAVDDALAAHLSIVLGFPLAPSDDDIRSLFDRVRARDPLNALASVVWLYPMDEPDVQQVPAPQFVALCEQARRIAAEYPELANVKIAVIYGSHGTPGIEAADIVGHDDYGRGPITIGVGPGQKRMLVAGIASPWHENPQAFVNAANADPSIAAIIGFIGIWPGQPGNGALENGMAFAWCTAGRMVTGKPGAC